MCERECVHVSCCCTKNYCTIYCTISINCVNEKLKLHEYVRTKTKNKLRFLWSARCKSKNSQRLKKNYESKCGIRIIIVRIYQRQMDFFWRNSPNTSCFDLWFTIEIEKPQTSKIFAIISWSRVMWDRFFSSSSSNSFRLIIHTTHWFICINMEKCKMTPVPHHHSHIFKNEKKKQKQNSDLPHISNIKCRYLWLS